MKKTPEQRGEELVTWMKNNNDRLIREVIQKPIGATTLKLLESGQEISLQSLIQLLQSDLDSQPRALQLKPLTEKLWIICGQSQVN